MLLVKKKVITIFSVIVLLFQIVFPTIYSYATEETEMIKEETEMTENVKSTEDEISKENNTDNEEKIEKIRDEVTEDNESEEKKDIEDTKDNEEKLVENEEEEFSEQEESIDKEELIKDIKLTNDKEVKKDKEEIENEITEAEDGIMLMSAGDVYVGNETEFRNALSMQASVIHITQSIDFISPVYINYSVTFVDESDSNALRYYGGGSFLVIQNGGSLTIDGMVIDGNTAGTGGVTMINIEKGGYVTFLNSSIVDGGVNNTGILINDGGSLLLWSCEIVRCYYGIHLQKSGNLYFATQDGRCNNFYKNTIGVYINNYSGNCNFNQNIAMYDNASGILTTNVSGSVIISAGNYYKNYNGINVGGSIKVTGGSFYSNTNGMCTSVEYTGKLTVTGGKVYSNSAFSIYHTKTNDEGCTLIGGSLSGAVYLAQKNNYVNTNSNYPIFTVTPSQYYFKRKLVKTNSNAHAKNEIEKVTLTPKNTWYKYIEEESQYIVLWTGGNVIVRCKDYNGNVIKTTTMNGTIGKDYSVTPPVINGYDLISTPSNAKGKYTQNDIIVELKYDIVNVAKVNFQDLLSGVISAKYWYNANSENFSGVGTDFSDGRIFENYGFYKITVINGVGLEKTITFVLNKDSVKR